MDSMDIKSDQSASCHKLQPMVDLKTACATCNLKDLCLPGGIRPEELARLDALVSVRQRVKKGDSLFNIGDEFNSLYAVRSGFFKSCINSKGGSNQILGFQIPGELLGLDGVASEKHGVDAIALEDSEVCVLPYTELERIAGDFPPLQHQLHRVMSREIVREHQVMQLLGTMKADERVAAFLLNLSERYRHLGYSANEFILRMTRQEIGNYLGLKLETVSRAFSRFQQQKIIEVDGKNIKLMNTDVLKRMISTDTP